MSVMTGGQRTALRVGTALFGLALLGMGAYFVIIGLDQADKVSSVIGSFTGLLGLALSIYALIASRSTPSGTAANPSGGHTVSGGKIDGDNIQIGPTGGNVNIRRG
jgi:hypothetical protein